MSEDLIQKIRDEYDPNEVLEAFQLTTGDLIDAFPERLEDNLYKFKEFADETEEA